jgi:hypothetical protein
MSNIKLFESKQIRATWDEMLKSNWGTICPLVEMKAADGKKRKVQASDTKGLLRIIQSIPSPKAEPFKLWLAQVGSERLEEIENPELATQRTRELYKLKGYPEDGIELSTICRRLKEFVQIRIIRVIRVLLMNLNGLTTDDTEFHRVNTE